MDALARMATAALAQLGTGEAPILRMRCDESLHAETPVPRDVTIPQSLHAETAAGSNVLATFCSLDNHAIATTVAERLACDGPIGRSASTTQRAKLRSIQYGDCAHPRCTNRSFLEGHHIIPWSHGGPTALNNLTLLCAKHYRQLHDAVFAI